MVSGLRMSRLRIAIAGLLAAVAPAAAQRPSEADAAAAIEKSRAVALDYSKSLPDFVCTETIERFWELPAGRNWLPTDTLTVSLSYFEQKEDHKLVLVNGAPAQISYGALQGAVGVGEFGGTLSSIFDPVSEAHFHWESWKTVRKHPAAVYSYAVEPAHSRYAIATGTPGKIQRDIVGYHGVVEVDRESGAVLHFTYQADHIPRSLDLDYALTTVDYDLTGVNGRNYWLPATSETESRGPRMRMLNKAEFRQYRKFGSESTLTFDPGK